MHFTILAAEAQGGLVDLAKNVGQTFGWDVKLFFSQVVSFVIVALLLRKFAYKPIQKVLEERRERIAQSLRDAERIRAELGDAEKQKAEILAKANAEAQKMIEQAREAAAVVGQRHEQEAIASAEQIIAKAHEASQLEHERVMAELKRELGRLVVDTTAKVTGKVLSPDDQRRLQEEAGRQVVA